jgi:hypothetical protein
MSEQQRNAPVGRQVHPGEEQPAMPQDQSGHPAPRNIAEVGDPLKNPHNVSGASGATLPEDYKEGRLTRKGMERVIAQGGSVLHGGQLHTSVQTLPSEAVLAKGDEQAEALARDNLIRQRQAIDSQLASLGAPGQTKLAGHARPEHDDAATVQARLAGATGGTPAGGTGTEEESPVSDSNADEAVETVGRMRSQDRLRHIAETDKRASVKAAAQKRLSELQQ